jgi:hypothetical protein
MEPANCGFAVLAKSPTNAESRAVHQVGDAIFLCRGPTPQTRIAVSMPEKVRAISRNPSDRSRKMRTGDAADPVGFSAVAERCRGRRTLQGIIAALCTRTYFISCNPRRCLLSALSNFIGDVFAAVVVVLQRSLSSRRVAATACHG